jgi:hypothetical protein
MTLSIIFSAASLILCGFSFLYFRSYLKKKISPQGLLEDYQDEVNKLIADIDAATDRDTYLVEDRIKSLKSLMDEIDKKLGVYVREFDRRRDSEGVYTVLGRKASAAVPPRPDPPPPPGERSPADPGRPVSVPPETPPRAAPPPAASGAAVPPEPATKPNPLREQIAEWAAQGLSPGVISTRLKVSLSEVDLALAIQNRSKA